MATLDLNGRSPRDQADCLMRLARSRVGVITDASDPPSQHVTVSVHRGRLHVVVNGYNVFFVDAKDIHVTLTSEKLP